MPHPVVHWELWSPDPVNCSEFYTTAFDRKVSRIQEMDYHMVDTGG